MSLNEFLLEILERIGGIPESQLQAFVPITFILQTCLELLLRIFGSLLKLFNNRPQSTLHAGVAILDVCGVVAVFLNTLFVLVCDC